MEKPLDGIYRVSFDIKVDAIDQCSLSDLTQSLTEGFGDGLLERVSHLSIEKVTKKGQLSTKVFRIGDKVQLTSDINLETEIYHDDGYVFIGTPNDISEKVTTEKVSMKIEAGGMGFINKINKDGSLEVIDLDKPYINSSWTEIGIDAVNIDSITVNAEQLEKIDSEEVK